MDGSNEDDEDPFDYDPFRRDDDGGDDGSDEAPGPGGSPDGGPADPAETEGDPPGAVEGGPAGVEATRTATGAGPEPDRDEDSTGLLGVDWSPRGRDVTILDRLRAVGVAIGLGVAGFVVALFVFQIAFLVLTLAGVGELTFVGDLIVGFIVLQGTSFPLVALAYLRVRGLPLSYLKARIPGLWDVAGIVVGFVLVVTLVIGVLTVISLTDAPSAERTDTDDFQENPDAILLMIPVSILLIGPAEELLFRGVIQTRLRESFGPVGAVVFANFAFAPLHVFALSGSASAVAVTIGALFVPGLVFGVAYELTDNLVVPSLIHGLYNALIFTSFYVSASASSGVLVPV